MRAFKRNPVMIFFLLAYSITWAFHIPRALSARGIIVSDVPEWFHFLGAYGPMVSAFLVLGITKGANGLRDLVSRMTRWRIGLRWLLIAAFSPAGLFLVSAALRRVVLGEWPDLLQFGRVDEFPQLGWYAGWLLWVLTFGLGEEVGWRGYALPILQRSRNARSATLTVGLLWAFWHLPAFFYTYEITVFGVFAFLVGILSGAAVLTWLYNSTGGSVLAAILWHGTYNAAVAGAEGLTAALVTAFIILGAVVIGNHYGPEHFSSRERHTI